MQRSCESCKSSFFFGDDDERFLGKISPTVNGVTYPLPPPRLCPECRKQRRLAFRNERKFYHRTCSHSGKPIISIISPDKPYKAFEPTVWWSDVWSALDYGREFDFSRPFFEQFAALYAEVPKLALIASNNENCEYVNYTTSCRNCYLLVGWGEDSEDCLYGQLVLRCRDCIDVNHAIDCECCYECLDIENCYALFYSETCKSCSESYFLKNCIGCSNCFGCVNLVNKRYCIFNKQLSKEDYFESSTKLLRTRGRSAIERLILKNQVLQKLIKVPRKYYTGHSAENSSGDYLRNCRNAHHAFDVTDAEDVRYVTNCIKIRDCGDLSFAGENNTEFSYECVNYTGKSCHFINLSWFCDSLLYCQECLHGCHDLFGCVGMHRSEYCILNRQYSREEYFALVPKIIEHMKNTGEWGEFFSAALSPFGYNETMAAERFPLQREEALKRGFNWCDYVAPISNGANVLESDAIAQTSAKDEAVLNYAFCCVESGRLFKLTKKELEFYQKHELPLPQLHPDVRYQKRLASRNPRKFYKRRCDNCAAAFESTYANNRPEIVYCESCYLNALI